MWYIMEYVDLPRLCHKTDQETNKQVNKSPGGIATKKKTPKYG